MSLELALQHNTAAIAALTAILQNSPNAIAGLNSSSVLANDKIEGDQKVNSEKSEAETKTKPETKTKAKSESKAESKTKTEPELTYGDISPLLLELAKKDRNQLVDLFAKHGVAKGTELKPEQFADVKADVEKLLNPETDDLV